METIKPKVDKESLQVLKAIKEQAIKTQQIVIKDGQNKHTGGAKR